MLPALLKKYRPKPRKEKTEPKLRLALQKEHNYTMQGWKMFPQQAHKERKSLMTEMITRPGRINMVRKI